MVRIVSWNVNGIRTLLPSLKSSLDSLNADIICLQETKISLSDPSLERHALVPGYRSFFSFCHTRGGYSGTATFTRIESPSRSGPRITPIDAAEGFDNAVGGASVDWLSHFHDIDAGDPVDASPSSDAEPALTEAILAQITAEGRVVITDHAHFVCINIYAPALSDPLRVPFKALFNRCLALKVRSLCAAGRNVLIAGDFNIRPHVIDGADAVHDVTAFNARPTRAWLRNNFLGKLELVDTFRALNPSAAKAYTCWSEATRARENNHGARIDLVVVNRELFGDVGKSEIMADVMGSDHCPIVLELVGAWAEGNREGKNSVVVPPAFCTKFLKRFAAKQRSICLFLGKSAHPRAVESLLDAPSSWSPPPLPPTPRPEVKRSTQTSRDKPARKRARSGEQSRIGAFFQSESVCTPTACSTVSSSKALPSSSSLERERELSSKGGNSIRESQESAGSLKHDARVEGLVESGLGPLHTPPNCDSVGRAKVSSDAKEQWRRLLPGPRPPPLCRHREPCVLKSVKKTGENKGRTFYSCTRPSGAWPTDPAACCNYFSWAPFQAGKLLSKR